MAAAPSLTDEVQRYLTDNRVLSSLSTYAQVWIRAHLEEVCMYLCERGSDHSDQPHTEATIHAELNRFIMWLQQHPHLTIAELFSSLNEEFDEPEVVITILNENGRETKRYLWEGPIAGNEVSDLWDFVSDDLRATKVVDLWGVDHLYSIYRQTSFAHPISWAVWAEMRSLAPSVAGG
jgi:hypothetical protein